MTDYEFIGKVKKSVNREELRVVMTAIKKLRTMIDLYLKQGTSFDKIFNNKAVKYKVFDNNFSIFKFVGVSNTQLRILYRYRQDTENHYTIEIHKIVVKRNSTNTNNPATQNEYIKDFEAYVENYIKGE